MKNLYKILFTAFLISASCLIGSKSLAHWTTKGPYGGKVTCMYTADTIIYVGTEDGGLYRSTTAAANAWRYVNYTNFNDPKVNAITSIGTSVFIGTPSGIMVSVDKGATWVSSNNNIGNTNILSLLASGNILYAGTEDGLYVSLNLGVTWTAQNTGLTSLHINDLFLAQGVVYAATFSGIYSKSLASTSWTSMNGNIAETNISHVAVMGNSIMVSTPSTSFYSDLTVLNWKPTGNLPGYLVNDISLDESGTKVYVSATTGIYSSSDLTNWLRLISGLTKEDTRAVINYSGKLYAGTATEGIFRSTSITNVSWASHNTGFNNLEANFVYNNGSLVIAATNKGLYISKDLAANYVKADLPDSVIVTGVEVANSVFYISTDKAGVFYSVDSGATWVNANISENYIVKIIASSEMLIAAGLSGKIYYTLIPTFNWLEAADLPENAQIKALAVNGTNVYAAIAGMGVYFSQDATSFTAINSGLTDLSPSSLAIRDQYLFAGTLTKGVLRRPLAGGSWVEMNSGLPDLRITALTSASNWLVAGYRGNVIVSYDNGQSWKNLAVQQYIPTYADINNISFTSNSTRVFISTPHNSVYSNGIGELPTTVSEINAMATFSVYPNPAKGQIFIDLSQVNGVKASLTISDITGKTVLSRSLMGSDKYEMGLELPAGCYMINVSSVKGSSSKKLIIQ